jgi:hypothetical protein
VRHARKHAPTLAEPHRHTHTHTNTHTHTHTGTHTHTHTHERTGTLTGRRSRSSTDLPAGCAGLPFSCKRDPPESTVPNHRPMTLSCFGH